MYTDPTSDLTAIVVAYNSAASIADTIGHLEGVLAPLNGEILVVDNASIDQTAEIAAKSLRCGRVIRSEQNLGFGGGINLGLQQAAGEFVLMLNDDVFPQPGSIEKMMAVFEDDTVGLAGAQMVNPDGSSSFAVRKHPPGLRDEVERIRDLLSGHHSRVEYPSGQWASEVGMLICACVMGRTDQLRALGGFNDAFFMYGEDIDLCRRLTTSGYRLMTVPTAIAVHQREISPQRRPDRREFAERILDARNTYYRIWLSRPERVLVNLFRAIGPSDQPFRLRYHLTNAVWDGPSLRHLRQPVPIDPDAQRQ